MTRVSLGADGVLVEWHQTRENPAQEAGQRGMPNGLSRVGGRADYRLHLQPIT